MEHHALVIRHGDLALLDAPAIICRSWHPSEDPNLEGEELELEIALHERGWRMCECYSRFVPEGEFGHIAQRQLLAITERDFEEALRLLRDQDLPEYEEHVYDAVARVPTRA